MLLVDVNVSIISSSTFQSSSAHPFVTCILLPFSSFFFESDSRCRHIFLVQWTRGATEEPLGPNNPLKYYKNGFGPTYMLFSWGSTVRLLRMSQAWTWSFRNSNPLLVSDSFTIQWSALLASWSDKLGNSHVKSK